jgi:hypothetical protein
LGRRGLVDDAEVALELKDFEAALSEISLRVSQVSTYLADALR